MALRNQTSERIPESRRDDRMLYLIVVAYLAVCVLGLATDPADAQEPPGAFPGATSKMLVDGWSANGFRRSYRLHVPTGHKDNQATPLVIALHGGVSNSKIFEKQSNFSTISDAEGFLVAYPNGIGVGPFLRHWNGGYCCARALKKDVDDIGFIDAVVEDVASRFQVDRSRVYLVGYSNGGMLAYMYAAEHPNKVAAIGIFASAPGLEESDEISWAPQTRGPVPMIHVHGFEDPRLRWRKPVKVKKRRKGPQATTLDPMESAEFWAQANACTETPTQQQFLDGSVTRWEWCGSGSSPVVLLGLEKWGHEWPGGRRTQKLRRKAPLRDFDAAVEMWAFFSRFSG